MLLYLSISVCLVIDPSISSGFGFIHQIGLKYVIISGFTVNTDMLILVCLRYLEVAAALLVIA